jgi:DNA-binding PadR family transcriptional regulator
MKIILSEKELNMILQYCTLNHTNKKNAVEIKKRIIEILSQWRSSHGNKQMPQWKLERTLRIDRKNIIPILEKMQNDGIVEFSRTTHRDDGSIINGRPSIGYKLCQTFCRDEEQKAQKVHHCEPN